jgi:hypothetical protein
MELGQVVLAAAAVVTTVIVWHLADWAWLQPRRIERALRAQGISGTSYKSLNGDISEYTRLMKEATSKPMELSHNIGPHVVPLLHKLNKIYGIYGDENDTGIRQRDSRQFAYRPTPPQLPPGPKCALLRKAGARLPMRQPDRWRA